MTKILAALIASSLFAAGAFAADAASAPASAAVAKKAKAEHKAPKKASKPPLRPLPSNLGSSLNPAPVGFRM